VLDEVLPHRAAHRTGEIMRRFQTITLAMCAVPVLTTFAVPSAEAAAPERGYFSFAESGTDPAGTTCDFAVDFSQVESGFFDVYFDRHGDVSKVMIHITYDATISGNGHVLTERDTFTRTLNPDGTVRDAGLTVHIQGPGGVVMRDAGLIAYSDGDETVSYVRGPHPQLAGASFCSALGG
jgi:hypothetical protein